MGTAEGEGGGLGGEVGAGREGGAGAAVTPLVTGGPHRGHGDSRVPLAAQPHPAGGARPGCRWGTKGGHGGFGGSRGFGVSRGWEG